MKKFIKKIPSTIDPPTQKILFLRLGSSIIRNNNDKESTPLVNLSKMSKEEFNKTMFVKK